MKIKTLLITTTMLLSAANLFADDDINLCIPIIVTEDPLPPTDPPPIDEPEVPPADLSTSMKVKWNTTKPGVSNFKSITIPTRPGYPYEYQVDWNNDGDLNDDDESTVYTGDATHEYDVGGVKIIQITGLFSQFYFNNSGDKEKIRSVERWGDIKWYSMQSAFHGASNFINNAFDAPDLSNVSSMYRAFRGAESLGNGTATWSNWDTSTVTNMVSVFRKTAFNADISSWDVENVTTFAGMFGHVTLPMDIYENILIGWEAQNLVDDAKFHGGNSRYCSIDARVAKANLTIDDNLEIVDGGVCGEGYFITMWKTQNAGTSNNSSITIPTDPALDYFYQVDWNGDGDFYDTDEDLNYTGNATHDYGLAIIGQRTVKISGIFPKIHFNNAGDKEKLMSVEKWGDYPMTNGVRAFAGASNVVINANDTPVFSGSSSAFQMFINATSIGTGMANWQWDTSNITNMKSMFNNTQFNKNIGSWSTFGVTNMNRMFANSPFDQDISSWRVDNVSNMGFMFQNTGLSTVYYDALLVGWEQIQVQPNVTLGAGNSVYCSAAAQTARADLIADNVWTIADAGVCSSNQAPTITSTDTVFVAENSTLVQLVTATDPESDDITYTISGSGDDDAKFILNSSTGELSFLTAPDFENPNSNAGTNVYLVEVIATDNGSPIESDSILIDVNVADVIENTAPTITTNAEVTIPENQQLAVIVEATDPESDAITYTISSGPDASKFMIDANTGQLDFIDIPDFEIPNSVSGNNEYFVEIRATDDGSPSLNQKRAFTIHVTDVIENADVDLDVVLSDDSTTVMAGGSAIYTLEIRNNGPDDAINSLITASEDPTAAVQTIASTSWTCVATGAATCSATGTGDISDTVNIPDGQTIVYTITATIGSNSFSESVYVAQAVATTENDVNPTNNSDSEVNINGDIIFKNSFEN